MLLLFTLFRQITERNVHKQTLSLSLSVNIITSIHDFEFKSTLLKPN